jgi:energy-coupling factor transporter transmembrane protein EcfT
MTLKSFAQKLKRFLKTLLFSLICIVYLFLLVWTFCYSLHIFYVLLFFLIASVVAFFRKKNRRFISITLCSGLTLFLLSTPYNLTQYNEHAKAFQERVNRNESLTFKEKTAIYGTLLIIIVGDIVPFPEACIQNFYLLFPKSSKTRVFYDDDFLSAPDIKAMLHLKGKNHVAWNKWGERFNGNFRFAAAFDPCTLEITDEGTYKKAVLSTYFHYRKNYTTENANHILYGLFAFRIDEGLFWYLAKEGWLHPYNSIWIAKYDK